MRLVGFITEKITCLRNSKYPFRRLSFCEVIRCVVCSCRPRKQCNSEHEGTTKRWEIFSFSHSATSQRQGCESIESRTILFQLQQNIGPLLLLLVVLVFNPWASLGRNKSPVRRPLWLWYAASWASSQGQFAIAFPQDQYIFVYLYICICIFIIICFLCTSQNYCYRVKTQLQ